MLYKKRLFLFSLVLCLTLAATLVASCTTTPAPTSKPAPTVTVTATTTATVTPKPTATATVTPTATAAAAPKQLRWLSASVGGPIFPTDAYWCSILSTALKMPAGAFPGAQVSNLPLLEKGEAELSYGDGSIIYSAYQGIAPFTAKLTNVRFLFTMGVSCCFCLVRNDSKIQTLNDLIGKKISVGFKGSGAEKNGLAQLEAAGITKAKVEAAGGLYTNLDNDAAANGLGDGTIDAAFFTSPPHQMQPAAIPIDQRFGLRVVPVPEAAINIVIAANPYLTKVPINGGLYKGSPQPVPALADVSSNVVRGDVPDDLVYGILNALYTPDVIKYTLANFPQWNLFGNINDMLRGHDAMPVHPGAIKFFKEKGGAI